MICGGPNAKKRAVIAVARKLAVLLHALWRSETPYRRERLATYCLGQGLTDITLRIVRADDGRIA
jgi:hypothetical protein